MLNIIVYLAASEIRIREHQHRLEHPDHIQLDFKRFSDR